MPILLGQEWVEMRDKIVGQGPRRTLSPAPRPANGDHTNKSFWKYNI